jgi:teichuronic acid biosynthesis glycosyltransferase TuaC
MKILFFSYAYPNAQQPGLGTFNRTMIAGLTAEHQVRVVAPIPFPEVWKGYIKSQSPKVANGQPYQAVPGVEATHPTFYYPPKIARSQYGRFLEWSAGRELSRAIADFQPDVILSYWAHPDGDVAVRAAERHDIPCVVMVGGSDVLLLARQGSRRTAILNVLQRADAVVAVSDHITDTLVKDGLSRKKLHVVRRGIDPTYFSPGDRLIARRGLGVEENTTLFIAVGRLVPVKGFQHLIDTCQVLKRRSHSFSCRILGEGPLRPTLQKQIDELGLQDCVKLEGAQGQMRLAEWYRAADATLLSSLSEGVPNVLLESLACGTPFVATSVGGVSEIADRVHDRLVPPAAPIAMADAIESQLLVKDDKKPRRKFEPSDLRASSTKLVRVLEGALYDHAARQQAQENNAEGITPELVATPKNKSSKFEMDWVNMPLTPLSSSTTEPLSTATIALSLSEQLPDIDANSTVIFSRPMNGYSSEELAGTGEVFTSNDR